MKIFRNLSFKNEQKFENKETYNNNADQYAEIGKLVKEGRVKKNISVEELSRLSKIPEYIINSIENNNEDNRPRYPFIRSILFKLEECLSLRKNALTGCLIQEIKITKKNKNNFLVRKFEFFDSWKGSLLYFLILILSIFILKRYFFFNENIIEIQNIEDNIERN